MDFVMCGGKTSVGGPHLCILEIQYNIDHDTISILVMVGIQLTKSSHFQFQKHANSEKPQ